MFYMDWIPLSFPVAINNRHTPTVINKDVTSPPFGGQLLVVYIGWSAWADILLYSLGGQR